MAVSKVGCVIGVKPEMLDRYIELHDNEPEEVLQLLRDSGYRKSEIFVQKMPDGKLYLFQYFEVEGDPAPEALYLSPLYREWLRITGECQIPLEGETFWTNMRHISTFDR